MLSHQMYIYKIVTMFVFNNFIPVEIYEYIGDQDTQNKNNSTKQKQQHYKIKTTTVLSKKTTVRNKDNNSTK